MRHYHVIQKQNPMGWLFQDLLSEFRIIQIRFVKKFLLSCQQDRELQNWRLSLNEKSKPTDFRTGHHYWRPVTGAVNLWRYNISDISFVRYCLVRCSTTSTRGLHKIALNSSLNMPFNGRPFAVFFSKSAFCFDCHVPDKLKSDIHFVIQSSYRPTTN